MSKRSANRCLAAGLALLLSTCLGCGTRRYEDRLQETVKRLEQESVFSQMQPPVRLSDTPVMVQFPRFFDHAPLPDDSDPRRLKPPSVDIPGLKLTYEGFITDSEGGKIPFYCYLAATEEDPARQLQRQVRNAFPAEALDWQSVDCPTPDGGTITWKQLQAEGTQGDGTEQEFYYVNESGQESFAKMPAKFLLDLRQEGRLFLVIAWRAPTSIEKLIGQDGNFGLDQWAGRVAGSVTVEEE
jgi:hypothetical protein